MSSSTNSNNTEVSIVIPCLNEADTLENCLLRAKKALLDCTENGEIIVADNNSTDDSAKIALENGAMVVSVKERGYGSALMGGISAAKGKFIVMGDADESHDLLEIPKFIEKLREGFDIAQGCRFPAGGGTISSGSMSFLHRRIGNPFFSLLVRRWFNAPIHDVYCGFRAFTRQFYDRLDQRCTGMEFAPEMIIKASFLNAKIVEVPVTHHPDGRKSHPPHLRTFRDGWRTLRFFLMYSPRWLFLLPGILLVLAGIIAYLLLVSDVFISSINGQIQTAMFGSLAILCGYQSILFAIFTKVFAISEGLLPVDERFNRFFEIVNLERGLTVASITLFVGFIFLVLGFLQAEIFFLEFLHFIFIGATMIAVGFQTILSGFFTSILGMKRK
ncbi:MAG TPA: glycosyltransferase family 2 protein [Pyrinomonadaceae bacterium]|nr:glycosyltransferase family 2 protein [Pyrinomonadaceae bacterium]